ncbi:hypothetical protein ACJJTC_007476 [Scirpophaga incertulas]
MSRADIRTTPVVSPSHRARSYTARASRGSDPYVSTKYLQILPLMEFVPLRLLNRKRQWAKLPADQQRRDANASRHTAPPPANAPPPSQRRTEFSTFTERFLRVEEHQVETQRTFAQILQTCVERNAERDRMLAEAMIAVGKGLDALAQAIKRD